jgi:addiction module RelB/DinJ family antitoxin
MLVRSATIQLRVTPLIKAASERVLWGIGLNMSEAVELFLRRVIVDQKIPFELIALETREIDLLPAALSAGKGVRLEEHAGSSDTTRSSKAASNTRAANKKFKKFLGTPASGKKNAKKELKNSA